MKSEFVIGTRGSLLARSQTELVAAALRSAFGDVAFRVVTVRTSGDAIADQALHAVGGKGLFTKELEDALADRRIDLAVHSLKDLPTQFPRGLVLGAVPTREDPRDALIGPDISQLQSKKELTIGTCSLRRAAQLRRLFPHVRIVDLRGNLDTRLKKVSDAAVDAAVLAVAGLRRIGLADRISHTFAPDQMLPAPGQGALAVEIRADDPTAAELVHTIHCPRSFACVTAEREVLRRLEAGCHAPLGALAEVGDGQLRLRARVLSLDGRRCCETQVEGSLDRPTEIGGEAAARLLEAGAAEFLNGS